MTKYGVVLLILFLGALLFLAGLYFLEESKCALFEQEYPDYHFRTIMFRCHTIINGKWIDVDKFVIIGRSP